MPPSFFYGTTWNVSYNRQHDRVKRKNVDNWIRDIAGI